jgi:hypothetical protein
MDVIAKELQKAVEVQHTAEAHLVDSTAVCEEYRGRPVWQGDVHIFELSGHPLAAVCYAWSSPIEGSSRRRFYAVLGVPPIHSAADAVRTAIVADQKAERQP